MRQKFEIDLGRHDRRRDSKKQEALSGKEELDSLSYSSAVILGNSQHPGSLPYCGSTLEKINAVSW